jgi:hypothetical protein
MLSRSSILALVLAFALLVYGLLITATMRKAMRSLVVVGCIHHHEKEADTEPFGIPAIPSPPPISIGGMQIPIANVIAGLMLIPGVCLTHDIATWRRRRRRERLNQCLQCGRPIQRFSGRCPGCGERIAPDRARTVHVLRG